MSIYKKLIFKLLQENKLQENDVIGLEFANYNYKHNKNVTIMNNISPTLTTNCNVVVAVGDKDEQ